MSNSELIGKHWEQAVGNAGVRHVGELDITSETVVQKTKEMLGGGGNITLEVFHLPDDGSGVIEAVNQYNMADATVSTEDGLLKIHGMEGENDPVDTFFQFGDFTGVGVQTHEDGQESLILFQNLATEKNVLRLTKRK